ncbi:Ig family protein [Anaeromyxobacter sp. K]|uniref:Ig domain-containing protein n=1 Tax=Anaeromyxobacter sp. (strain K) TaxID=447217 RepID=UPI00015F8742|nr:Ig domain-containing protein [Anaeromyxobacter sp. K]ACG74587.1 Ig family protein [Anaeromyxobacter sp. K]
MPRNGQTSVRIVPHAIALMVLCACDGSSSALPAAPAGLAYSENPAVYLLSNAIEPNVPSSRGGPVTSYAVWPPLPAGLTLDRSSGVISGTPTSVAVAGSYHVTAANGGGACTATIRITVKAEGTDASAPELVTLSIAPTTIDTSTEDQVVLLTAHLTDDLSGVSGGSVTFSSPSGFKSLFASPTQASGDGLDGIYTFTITAPRYTELGTWHLMGLQVSDNAGNVRSFPETELVSRGLPTTFVNAGASSDTAGPQLRALAVAPATIDTTEQAQLVTVTARLVDDLAGVGPFVSVALRGPSGTGFFSGGARRISGDALDGVYTFTVEVPRYAESGTWHLEDLSVSDRAGNAGRLSEPELVALGFPTTFVNVGTVSDTAAPQLLALSITPTIIDTRAQAQTVTLTVRLADNLSGMAAFALVGLASPSSTAYLGVTPTLVWGDGLDGIYEITIDVPRYAEFGTWHLTELWLSDNAGNRASFPEAELRALGFPTTFGNGL